MSASFHPWAECLGVDGEGACSIEWGFGQSDQARDQAKRHAEQFPGHSVRVVAERVDLYMADPS
jgi:hypothetical protein